MEGEKSMSYQRGKITDRCEEVTSLQSSISAPFLLGEHLKEFLAQGMNPHFNNRVDVSHPEFSLEHIIAVGALYTVQKGLYQRDKYWLRNAIRISKDYGFHLKDVLRVTPLNLWDGCDFLREPYSSIHSDLLIICLVLNPQNEAETTFCAKATMFGARDCRVSGEHNKEGSWRSAVEKSRPKIVVTFSEIENPREVRGCDLAGPNYLPGPESTISAVSLQTKSYALRDFRMETLLRKDIAEIIESNGIHKFEKTPKMTDSSTYYAG